MTEDNSENVELTFGNFTLPTPQYFIGRQNELQQLHNAMGKSNFVMVGGLAGIGKTYYVAEYIKFASLEKQTLWFDCNIYSQTEQIIVRLADFIHINFKDKTLTTALRSPQLSEIRRYEIATSQLDQHKIVLVLDNFTEETSKNFSLFLRLWNQALKTGRIIFISRERYEISNLINRPFYISLQRLSQEEGIKLLDHYLNLLGMKSSNDQILIKAYKKVGGYPYFLTLLASLAELFSLSDLVDHLPTIEAESHKFLQEEVFNHLGNIAKALIKNLSVLRIPFKISAISFLPDSIYAIEAFEELARKFLVSRRNDDSERYEMHDLIREYAYNQIELSTLQKIHKCLADYYHSLSNASLLDRLEQFHHEIEANLFSAASDSIARVLWGLQRVGMFDLILEMTGELLKDHRVSQLGIIYHMRGRTYRFKEMFDHALIEYELAVGFAQDEDAKEKSKYELASIISKSNRSKNTQKLQQAISIYEELQHSSNNETQINALNGLASLQLSTNKEIAFDHLLKAAEIAKSIQNSRLLANTYQSIGAAYIASDNPQKGIEYLEQVMKLRVSHHENYGDTEIEAEYFLYENLAYAFDLTKNFKKAVFYSQKCVDIDRKLKIERRLAHSLYHLGRNGCQARLYKQAESNLNESLFLIETHDIKEGAKRAVTEWLVVALWMQGKYLEGVEKSLEYQYICIKDKVKPNQHTFIRQSDLRKNTSYEISNNGYHILILPKQYGLAQLDQWRSQIIAARPELGIIQNLTWRGSD